MKTTGQNEPCPCGSGRKFRKCHGANKKKRGIPAWVFFVALGVLGAAGVYYTTRGGGESAAGVSSNAVPSVSLPVPGGSVIQARFENIPGFALSDVSPVQKKAFLDRVNTESCTCGCVGDTVAKCIVQDPACQVAPAIAHRILAEVRVTAQ